MTWKRIGWIAGALAALAILLIGYAYRRLQILHATRPIDNVLVITVDTLRPDYLSLEGHDRPTSPFLDSLIERGIYFRNATTPVPRTTPALASLLTGTYPRTHGVRSLTDRLRDDIATLPELARASGFRTMAIVSNHILMDQRGLNRGFDLYDHHGDGRDAFGTTASTLHRVDSLGDSERLFLWVHYIDPHAPYWPPERLARSFDPNYRGRYTLYFGSKKGGVGPSAYPADLGKPKAVFQNDLPDRVNDHVRRLYAADIRATDDAIRQLVEGLRQRRGEDWLIVFSADHAESLGEHDFYYDHGDYVYNATVRVPLAFVLPSGMSAMARAGERDSTWVSLVDLAPTLVDLMGLDAEAADLDRMEGRSLAPALLGQPLPKRAVFAESGSSFHPEYVRRRQSFDVAGRFRATILDGWKLIWTPGLPNEEAYELFDLAQDPGETHDLFRPDHPRVPTLLANLEGWLTPEDRSIEPAQASPNARNALSEEDVRALESLGYLEAGDGDAPAP